MTTLQRVSWVDEQGYLANRWFPTVMTAEHFADQLKAAGYDGIDGEEVEVPWDHIADLIHFLNTTSNTPPEKEPDMSSNPREPLTPLHPLEWPAVPPVPEVAVAAPVDLNALKKTSALDTQVGGSHYQTSIQPIEYIHANSLPFIEGNVVKYITRWRDKGGIKDLEKIKHYIDLLIELETRKSKE